ncbi:MAG: signal peptidase II [Flavobacteriaceae bacterium]|nr:signal peptidase II [Bacteroidia bacterium]NNL60041.1 signal peptidase II [Flavobacteriaceae bacterium]
MKLSRKALVFGLIIFNIIIDQVSKFLVRQHVEFREETKLIGDAFIMTNVENSGAFLGLGSDLNPTVKLIVLLILPVVVLFLALRYVLTNKLLDQWTIVGLSFVIGGGIGNIYDRIVYGSVTDFFHIDLGGIFRTGIFNIADVSVMIGMGCILVSAILNRKKEPIEELPES